MSRIILITGGARSGKSRLAEEMAIKHGGPLGYLQKEAGVTDETIQQLRTNLLV